MSYTADELYAVLKYIQDEQILVLGPWSDLEDEDIPEDEFWIDVCRRQMMGRMGAVWLQRAYSETTLWRLMFDGAGEIGQFTAYDLEAAQKLADRQLQSSHGGTEWWRLVDPQDALPEAPGEPVSRADLLRDRKP